MSRIPITIEKIKVESKGLNVSGGPTTTYETIKYLFKLDEKGQQWERTFICDRNSLLKLREDIDFLIQNTTTGETLNIPNEQAQIIDEHFKSDPLCKKCTLKLTHNCVTCIFQLQSPLERRLFLELKKANINFKPQYGLDWIGREISVQEKKYGDPENNFKDVLTVVDFFIFKGETKLCVYTDGHTYHERTEEQAQRDRNIDRKLQELDYTVLRYTGKDVNGDINKIITDIQKWIKKA